MKLQSSRKPAAIFVSLVSFASLICGASVNAYAAGTDDEFVLRPVAYEQQAGAQTQTNDRAAAEEDDFDLFEHLDPGLLSPSLIPSAKAQTQVVQASGQDTEKPALIEDLKPEAVLGMNEDKSSAPVSEQAPVDMEADSLIHDEKTQTITAKGNVQLIQAGRILKADEVVYNLKTDLAVAKGDVILNEPSGDVYFADRVELSDNMKRGFVTGLQAYLQNGGRLTAEEGERKEDGNVIVLQNASYTPCDCNGEDHETPGWRIKADTVTYDKAEHRIEYGDATFEIFGVPVLYTPYLAHSDGQVKRESGFLNPGFGYDSELGLILDQKYYWDIAPNRDATFGLMIPSKELPVALGEYRHHFGEGTFETSGSVTYSDRTDSSAGEDDQIDEDFRGHLFADGLWHIDNKWRAGLGIEVASDDQYLREYDFSGKNVLENELYVERFSGRNYTVGKLAAFQDVRIRDQEGDQPNVLPEISSTFVGEPNQTFGGRWDFTTSVLGLQRDNGQDMWRVSVDGGWERRDVTDFGLVTLVDLSMRADAYNASDRDVADGGTGRSEESSATRFFPQAHLETSYPFVRPYEKFQAVIEPTVALTLAPNIEEDDEDIPNEDSLDVQLDASNLFEPNRYPGLDRVEDRSRFTYGMKTGLYAYDGSRADVFLGQSLRFVENDNPFPNGSGLSRQKSDFVGQINALYQELYGVNYRFQINSDDMSSRRHELDAFAHWDVLQVNTRYLFADGLEGTDIEESREQIEGAVGLFLNQRWRLRGQALYDLGVDDGLREAAIGIDYFGCCVSVSLTAERNLTDDASGDSGTELMLRLGLKGLGGFETSDRGRWGGRTQLD